MHFKTILFVTIICIQSFGYLKAIEWFPEGTSPSTKDWDYGVVVTMDYQKGITTKLLVQIIYSDSMPDQRYRYNHKHNESISCLITWSSKDSIMIEFYEYNEFEKLEKKYPESSYRERQKLVEKMGYILVVFDKEKQKYVIDSYDEEYIYVPWWATDAGSTLLLRTFLSIW